MRLSRTSRSALMGLLAAVACTGLSVLALAAAGLVWSYWPAAAPTAAAPGPEATGSPTQTPGHVEIPGVCSGSSPTNILVLGIDNRQHDYEAAVRADTISVVSVRFDNRSAAVLGIPRDLYVALPDMADVTEGRINTAYAYGEARDMPGGGPGLSAQTVTLNFGIRLDRYVVIDFDAFVRAVDAIGGIDIDVPEPIYDAHFPADDGVSEMVLEIPAGRQHMDGAMALRYARTRHQDNDFERIRRQQAVMLAIREKMLSASILPRLPELIQATYGSVRTDLSLPEIAALACIGQQIDRGAIRTYVIDGQYVMPWVTDAGAAVVIPDREALGPVVREFNGEA